MAIDSAEKRKSIVGISIVAGPGVTPNVAPDAEWRQEAGYSYSGIAVAILDDSNRSRRRRRLFAAFRRRI